MVNFRYHLVSLIAVFLALAVGVVLGAGPLQNSIARQGHDDTGQASREQLQAALDAATAQADHGEVFARAVSGELLPGTLEGMSVALVALPAVAESDLDQIGDTLTTAGATLAATVRLTEEWTSADAGTYRDTLATPVSGYLQTRPAEGTSAAILATGLAEVLTTEGADVDLVRDILTDDATPLVDAGTLPDTPVSAIVLVGPSGSETAAEGQVDEGIQSQEAAPMEREIWIALAQAVHTSAETSAAIGQAGTEDDFIATLRQASSPIATVDQGGTAMSALNVALVLATGATGAFGQQDGATAPLAPLP